MSTDPEHCGRKIAGTNGGRPLALVTGGAGYVGSHCCKEFARNGWDVVVYDNLSSGWRDMVRWGPLIEGDVRDLSALSSAIGATRPDVVVHFAAVAYVGESVERPDIYYDVNVTGALTLLDAMRRHEVSRLIFSSSCATYGRPAVLPIDETSPQAPINPYGWSKLFAERMILDYAQAYQLRYAILRYFNAAGASPDGDIGERHEPETHLIPLVIKGVLHDGHCFTIHGDDFDTADGTCIRDYVHVSDLARAHILAAEQLMDGGPSLTVNLGAGDGVSVREIVRAVEHATRRTLSHRIGPRRAGDPAALVASTARARDLLGWTPAFSSLDDIISTARNWAMKDNTAHLGTAAE